MRRILTFAWLVIAPAALAQNPGVVQTNAAPGFGSYIYDGSGNIIQAGPRAYTYDRIGRLSSVTNGALTEQAYTYDRHGNLLTITTSSVSATNVTTSDTTRLGVNPATNRIDQNNTNGVANNMVATYDAFGNVAWSPTGSFAYDQFNMPKESNVGGLRTLYLYSASDERIASVHPDYAKEFWTIRDPGGRVLRRMDRNAGTWSWSQDYIYGAGRQIASAIPGPAKVLHYHADHLGTPRLITGNGGAKVGRHDYYPFGLEMAGGTNDGERLKFTGHERDAATLDYMHARYYDPSMGRFLSVDPGQPNAQRPQSWNRYAYTENNPIARVDADGRDWYSVLFQTLHKRSGTYTRTEHEAIVWIDPRGFGTTYEHPLGHPEYVGPYLESFAETGPFKLYPTRFRNLGPTFDPVATRGRATGWPDFFYETGRLQCTVYCAYMIGDDVRWSLWSLIFGVPAWPDLATRAADGRYIPGVVVNGQMWPADMASGVGGEYIEVTAPRSTTRVSYPDSHLFARPIPSDGGSALNCMNGFCN